MNCICRMTRAILWLFLAAAPSAAHATRAIANWDVVPFQKVEQPMKVGVVAFHETGVDVVFRVNGREVARVTEPTWNDRTRVHEYWFELRPADYPDGPLVLSATAIPDGAGHEPRELSDLTLFANSGGTLTHPTIVWADAEKGNDETGDGTEAAPFATIRKAVLAAGDGGTVYLKAGRGYKLTAIGGAPFTYWTTVTAAPGLTADDVHILTAGRDDSSTNRYNKSGICWKNVSLYCDRKPGFGNIFYLGDNIRAWCDGAVLYDKNGRFGGTTLFNRGICYVTDSLIRDVANVFGDFHRNVRMERILSDTFRGRSNLTVINVEIDTVDRGDTGAHPDFFQMHAPGQVVENIILYNVKAIDAHQQGIFGGPGTNRDIAFVNVLFKKNPPNASLVSQVTGDWQHVLLWHTTMVYQAFNFRETAQLRHWDVRNCIFDTFAAGAANTMPADSQARGVHVSKLTWQQREPLGEGTTVGDSLFIDPARNDFRLKPESPAAGSGVAVPGVPADIDGHPYDPNARDRGALSRRNVGRPFAPPR